MFLSFLKQIVDKNFGFFQQAASTTYPTLDT
jgi:hypothetical protein